MTDDPQLKKELIESYKEQQPKNKTVLDQYEAIIISVFILALTAALISGRLSEVVFAGLMGSFIGYTFGRIFNGWQGKE